MFQRLTIFHIPRAKNARADALSRLATVADSALDRTYLEHLEIPSILETIEIHQVEHVPSCMDHFTKYLTDDIILENPSEGCRFKWKAF